MQSFFKPLILFITVCIVASCKNHSTEEFYLQPEEISAYLSTNPPLKKAIAASDSFYSLRDYRYAWIDHKGLNKHAENFISRMENEMKYDSASIYDIISDIRRMKDVTGKKRYRFSQEDTLTRNLELTITAGFFRYAQLQWQGIGGKKLKAAGWNIEQKKENYIAALDSILKEKPEAVHDYEPVYFQYSLLREQLKKYREGMHSLPPGDNLQNLEKFLIATGDLKPGGELSQAIKQFQLRHRLEQTGIINDETRNALNIPLAERLDQIMLNIERSKWIPEITEGDFVFINIPEYKLFVYYNNELQWSCDVVVGTDSTATVVFNDYMETIVFSPYWNLPKSIIENETLPKVLADPSYLESHNMEIVNDAGEVVDASDVDWSKAVTDFPYSIRQKPGENNSLGKVKFLFPNSHSIYLHDTPAKSLFGETDRAFSHGCVRVSEPVKLASYLLRNQPEWTSDSIQNAMNNEKEVIVKIRPVVPVFIAYFTAWVDEKGLLHFRDDIYSHDQKLKRIMLL